MGLISEILNIVFGSDRNVLKDTVEVFRGNAEADAGRAHNLRLEALMQHAQEFGNGNESPFNRFMDALNRLPRPALALGTLGLFLAAMIDPIWFAARMQGISLVPEPLWWLLGVVVSFYFGARHQIKSQQFQRSIAQTMLRAPHVAQNIKMLRRLRGSDPGANTRLKLVSLEPEENAALEQWFASRAAPATK